METFLQTIRNLGPMRLAVIGGVVLGMVAFFIYLTTRLSTPQMALLYSDLEAQAGQKMVEELQAQNVPYEVRNQGSAIYVPQDKVAEMRMRMAGQGLQGGGSMGYEVFDKQDSLGTTNFMQNVNLVRALEGELSRSIRTMENVQQARVHLVFPKRELFSRERREPSASILLKMRGANRLNAEQVEAVRNLVAGAIPGLNPNKISLVDDKGTLLAGGFEEQGPGAMASKAEERRRNFESRLAHAVEDMLQKTVGFGKVRAEVSAEMDYDRVSRQQELYDPEGQVVRSTQTIEENEQSQEKEQDQPVSVGQNLPDAPNTQGDNASAQASRSRTEETVNYEISKEVVNHVREGGEIDRLSVAVLVDGRYTVNEETGERVYEPRSEEEMEQLAALVRGVIGFDADRGDTVELINMKFAEPPIPEEEPLELFFGFDKDDLLRMAEILVLSIVAILVILLVVRPLVSRAFESLPSGAGAEGGLLAEKGGAPQLTGPGGAPLPVPSEGGEEEEEFEELIDIDRVEGRVKASSVKKVGEIVDKHPEEALSILRSWMYQES